MSRLKGRPLPDDEEFMREGFLTEKVGLKVFERKGERTETERDAEETRRLRREDRLGARLYLN